MQTNHAWKNSERTKNYVNGIRASFPLGSEQFDVMLFVLRHFMGDVHRFLDLGCGSGAMSQAMFSQYPHAHAVMMDYSEPMLAFARQNVTPDQAVILHHDLNHPLDLANHAPFDVIVSGYAIHHLPNERKQALYREIYGLLRQGGVFINMEHVASPSEAVEDLFIHAITDNVMANGANDGRTREEVEARFREDDGDIVVSVEEQCAWLREIGFQDVDCYMKIYAMAIFGGRKLA